MQARNQEPVTLIRRHQGRHFKRFGKTRRLTGLSGMRVPPNILGVSQDGGTDSGRSTELACERARARFCSGARMAEPWEGHSGPVRFERSLQIDNARDAEGLLAYVMN